MIGLKFVEKVENFMVYLQTDNPITFTCFMHTRHGVGGGVRLDVLTCCV